jgi:hypothetical protein
MGLGSSLFDQEFGEIPRVIVCVHQTYLQAGPDIGSKDPQLNS